MADFRTDTKNFSAEANLGIGVQLRSQIVDISGTPTGAVVTGGALRAHAVNLGVISFKVQMNTKVIGNGVTNTQNSDEWTVTLLLPGSSGARNECQEDTELLVSRLRQQVAFRSVCKVEYLMNSPLESDRAGHYQSSPIDVFGTTTA